jgi:hypothetical protein
MMRLLAAPAPQHYWHSQYILMSGLKFNFFTFGIKATRRCVDFLEIVRKIAKNSFGQLTYKGKVIDLWVTYDISVNKVFVTTWYLLGIKRLRMLRRFQMETCTNNSNIHEKFCQ